MVDPTKLDVYSCGLVLWFLHFQRHPLLRYTQVTRCGWVGGWVWWVLGLAVNSRQFRNTGQTDRERPTHPHPLTYLPYL